MASPVVRPRSLRYCRAPEPDSVADRSFFSDGAVLCRTDEKVSEPVSVYTTLCGGDSFVSLTAEGQPAMMSYTGVAQIYSLHWKH